MAGSERSVAVSSKCYSGSRLGSEPPKGLLSTNGEEDPGGRPYQRARDPLQAYTSPSSSFTASVETAVHDPKQCRHEHTKDQSSDTALKRSDNTSNIPATYTPSPDTFSVPSWYQSGSEAVLRARRELVTPEPGTSPTRRCFIRTPSEMMSPVSSPASSGRQSRSYSSAGTEEAFDTPMTSPNRSPTRSNTGCRKFSPPTFALSQLDGGRGSVDDYSCPEEVPRQRRLVATGLSSPDRFIPSRVGTPTKEAYILSKPPPKIPAYGNYSSQSAADSDPFAPRARRSVRMAEQFATLRSPPGPLRPAVRRATPVVDTTLAGQRAVSDGAIWHVGGTLVTEGVASTTNGRGGRVTSSTSAPHHTADFLRKTSTSEDEKTHARRLALAMDLEPNAKLLGLSSPSSSASNSSKSPGRMWRDGEWEHETPSTPTKQRAQRTKDIPIIPFRVLDAPSLRDDFYCSLLCYSPTVECLAVGLGAGVYLWSETRSALHSKIPDSLRQPFTAHVTSISFSSPGGGSAILAIGRADGRITLWSPLDRDPRFTSEQPAPISCVCFRPTTSRRQSIREPCVNVATEELLVGDEAGNVYFYSVEWPAQEQRELFDWHGSMTLLARLSCHTQQICGLAWSPDGEYFASGGNDNQMFLFETKKILQPSRTRDDSTATINVVNGNHGTDSGDIAGQSEVLAVSPGQQKHVFTLNAAVKAIAFAPWQPSLLAAGGGSNDRCIHFFHTLSGASLATIDCHAQVTSLVWSERRKEIAVTFGFAQPDHPFRVAVFAWPGCNMVVGIPWWSEERALYAVAYPRGPSGGLNDRNKLDAEGRPWYGRRTKEEGCLVVATSDASIKFHEIWAERSEDGKRWSEGILGGSQILEGECSAEVERKAAIR